MATYAASVGEYGTRLRFRARRGGGIPGTGGAGWSVPPLLAFIARKPAGQVVTIEGNFYIVSLSACEFDWEPISSAVLDSSGPWEMTLSVVHGTEHYLCDPVSMSIGPGSPVTPGSVTAFGTATQIQAQLDALGVGAGSDDRHEMVMPAGAWNIDTTIRVPSWVTLRGIRPGAARLVDTRAGKTDTLGDTDDPTNALISLTSTVASTGTVSTATCYPGTRSLAVADADDLTDLEPGDWVLLFAANAVLGDEAPEESDSDTVIYYEPLQLRDDWNGASPLTFRTPARQYHGLGVAVRRITTPVIGAKVESLYLDGAPTAFHAVGVQMRTAIRSAVKGCTFRGFSRAGVNLDNGAKENRLDGLITDGCCNAIYLEVSGIDNVKQDVQYTPGFESLGDGGRYHPATTAVPRGAVHERFGCTGSILTRVSIAHGVCGLSLWGSKGSSYGDIRIRDLDPTQMRSRMTAIGEQQTNGVHGVALWMGNGIAGPTGFAEYSFRIRLERFQAEDILHPHASDIGVFIHDTRQSTYSQIELQNLSATAKSFGVMVHDAHNVDIENVYVRGYDKALAFQNDPQETRIRGCRLYAGRGDGSAALEMIYFNTTSARGIVLEHVSPNGYAPTAWFAFGSGFLEDSAHGYEFQNFRFDVDDDARQVTVGKAVIARNATATVFHSGGIYEWDRTSPEDVRRVQIIAAATSDHAVGMLGSPNAAPTWLVVQDLSQPHVLASTSALVSTGDLMRAVGSGSIFIEADNTPSDPSLITGRSLRTTGATGGRIPCEGR